MGWTNVFHCEINPFGQKVLKYYWPEAISYGDIKTTDFTIHRGQIDVLSGGVPCQPASTAGKRKGKSDDRWLWPEWTRAVREIRPRFAVAENVRGLLSLEGGLVFDQVLSDLESEGYEVLPFLLPACAVNAPHRRDRIWIVAHRTEDGIVTNSRHTGQERRIEERQQLGGRREAWSEPSSLSQIGSTPDTGSIGQQGQRKHDQSSSSKEGRNRQADWTHDANERWERFPTQPPLCGRNDGLPPELLGITVSKHRKESLMAYGNAIVPQVAYGIFKALTCIEYGKVL